MTEIKEDVFDIVQRIKGIDSGYKVYRNHKKHRFEVYKTYGMSEKLELTWDGALDERLVRKVQRTRKQNIDKIIKQIEKENENLQKQKNNELFNEIMQNVKI